MNNIVYEWCWEKLDQFNDVVDLHFSEKPKPKPFNGNGQMVLLKRVGNEFEGEIDRQYAYIENNLLPLYFPDGSRVPNKYAEQFRKFNQFRFHIMIITQAGTISLTSPLSWVPDYHVVRYAGYSSKDEAIESLKRIEASNNICWITDDPYDKNLPTWVDRLVAQRGWHLVR